MGAFKYFAKLQEGSKDRPVATWHGKVGPALWGLLVIVSGLGIFKVWGANAKFGALSLGVIVALYSIFGTLTVAMLVVMYYDELRSVVSATNATAGARKGASTPVTYRAAKAEDDNEADSRDGASTREEEGSRLIVLNR